jgi:hypothetical protein
MLAGRCRCIERSVLAAGADVGRGGHIRAEPGHGFCGVAVSTDGAYAPGKPSRPGVAAADREEICAGIERLQGLWDCAVIETRSGSGRHDGVCGSALLVRASSGRAVTHVKRPAGWPVLVVRRLFRGLRIGCRWQDAAVQGCVRSGHVERAARCPARRDDRVRGQMALGFGVGEREAASMLKPVPRAFVEPWRRIGTPRRSGGAAVFVDESAEHIDPFDTPDRVRARAGVAHWWSGYVEVDAAVGAGGVVVPDVVG